MEVRRNSGVGTEEPQPAQAFLEALSTLLGRWLLIHSTTPEMDAVTVLCRVRGYIYIARHGYANGEVLRQSLAAGNQGRGMEQSL